MDQDQDKDLPKFPLAERIRGLFGQLVQCSSGAQVSRTRRSTIEDEPFKRSSVRF